MEGSSAPCGSRRARLLDALTIAICLVVFAFVATRAVRVALTYDEAATYIKYLTPDFLSVFNFAYATNHFLNTFLTRVSMAVAGDRDWVLRLPALIGCVLYLACSVRLLRKLGHPLLALGGIVLLTLNPYLLEYFALSRGYGLALGLFMGALFFLFQLTTSADEPGAVRAATWGGAMAAAATLANFAMLNACLALLMVGLVVMAVRTRQLHGSPQGVRSAAAGTRWRTLAWLTTGAATFTLLVLSQDVGMTPRLYRPVVVRLPGLGPEAITRVRVSLINVRLWPLEMARRGVVWRRPESADAIGVRVELPVADVPSLDTIDVSLGGQQMSHKADGVGWTMNDDGDVRVFESGPSVSLPRSRVAAFKGVINWGGDGQYLGLLAQQVGAAMAVWVGLAACVLACVWLAARAGVMPEVRSLPFAYAILTIAAVAGGPLYLLARDEQLYFGGSGGLLADTFGSLVEASLHGRAYFPNQTAVVLTALGVAVAGLAIALVVTWRTTRQPAASFGLGVLAVLLLTSGAALLEWQLRHTPLPTGRTALVYVPLLGVFVVCALTAIAGLGRVGEAVAVTVMLLAGAAVAWHSGAVANVTSTWDWPQDAATRQMIADLDAIASTEPSTHVPVVVAVDGDCWPVAEVYARRRAAGRLLVIKASSVLPPEFEYMKEGEVHGGSRIITRYPTTGMVLARTR